MKSLNNNIPTIKSFISKRIINLNKTIILIFILSVSFTNLKSQHYKRIISLSPSLTINLYSLESKENLIGCTSYCEIAKPDKKEIVGTILEINIEKIIMLNPDLILATTLNNSKNIETLKNLGFKVEIFSSPHSFDEICQQYIYLSEMLDKKDLAIKKIEELRKQINNIKLLYINRQKKKFFFQIGVNPIFAVVPNTFMDEYITVCGGINIANNLKGGTLTRETVINSNPDIIIITSMGLIGENEKKKWEQCKTINAVKKNKIFFIDPNIACVPTPETFVKSVEIISNFTKNE